MKSKKENFKIESIREAYGKALVECGELFSKLVVVEADVSSSTMTNYFYQRFPDRFFNVGIAEEGMINIAAGLALGGFIPFANSFASLISYRACEQIRTSVAYNNVNVKVVASFAGVSDFKDGPTHHSLFDLAIMRSMPNMTVLVPADSTETKEMVKLAAEFNGPVYLRLSRGEFPKIFEDNHEVVIGKGVILAEGDDLTIISCGNLLSRVLIASEDLRKKGIQSRIININTLKPIDKELIIDSAKRTGAIITIEEHNIIGGLFSAVSECLCNSGFILVEPIGIKDEYARTAKNLDILFDYLGLTVENIIKTAKEIILKKKRMNCNRF